METMELSHRSITIHNFSEKINDRLVHFHVMSLQDCFFLWVGFSARLCNLAVAMSSRFDSMPLSSLILGDKSDTTSSSFAQRLGEYLLSLLFTQVQKSARVKEPYFHTCGFGLTSMKTGAHPPKLLVSLEGTFTSEKEKLPGRVSNVSIDPHLPDKGREYLFGFNWAGTYRAKKTKKQVFASVNIPANDSQLMLLIEKRIKEEMESFPEKF